MLMLEHSAPHGPEPPANISGISFDVTPPLKDGARTLHGAVPKVLSITA